MHTNASILLIEYADGSLYSEASQSAVPLMDIAKRIRVSGEYDGAAVIGGCVLRTADHPVYDFRCAKRAPEVKAEPKPIAEPKSEPRKKK